MPHDVTLGRLIETDQQRDAIHLAVAPVVAAEKLSPGQDIGFVGDDTIRVLGTGTKHIGIVDPFLRNLVYPEQRFWMFLYPNTVTGMRHEWAHPAFGSLASSVTASEEWLRGFARGVYLDYETVIESGKHYIRTGHRFIQDGSSAARDDFNPEYWKHFQLVTGLVPLDSESPFCCTC